MLPQRLEARRMLADAANTWAIVGTDAGESITISLRPSDSRLIETLDGNVVATRKLIGLQQLSIDAGGGNDVVNIDLAKPISGLSIWINGGSDRDVLSGGAGDEMILGGSGRDVLNGGGGNDTLRGGTDRDELYGGDGNDYLQGNAGYDTLSGGWGTDKLTGGAGDDQLRGGEDNDRLYGGPNPDTLKGGEGDDILSGGGAANAIFASTGDLKVISPFDTTHTDTINDPLKRLETSDDLKQWLIDRAAAQWSWAFGNPIGGIFWTWTGGGVIKAPTSIALDSDFSALAPTGSDYSTTNTQVGGVDEADTVKTDGNSLFILDGNQLIIADANPAGDLHQLSKTDLSGSAIGMYLVGSRLAVVSQVSFPIIYDLKAEPDAILPPIYRPTKPQTTVTVYDVSNPASPAVISTTTLDGYTNSSRVVDGRLYLVMQNYLNAPAPKIITKGDGSEVYESESSYRAALADSIDDIIPQYTTDSGGSGAILAAPDVYVRDDQRLDSTSVVLININDQKPAPIDSASVIGASGQVYASPTSLYLAGDGWWNDPEKTSIIKFGLGQTQVTLDAAGTFSGHVLNQFSMDESGQYFRLASTNSFGDGSASTLSIFDQVGDELNLVGSIGGLGIGEQIKSARFIGDKAYLTTFRQIDPLFVINLADPANPTVAGTLEVPGFSNYLHPVGDNALIGLGHVVNNNEPGDLQLSLFDVSDPAHPKRVDTYEFPDDNGWSTSAADWDSHAFSFFADRNILALPVTRFVKDNQVSTLEVLKVDPTSGFTSLGAISADSEVQRSVRIGDDLFSISSDSVQVADFSDLSHIIASMDLPAPPPIILVDPLPVEVVPV